MVRGGLSGVGGGRRGGDREGGWGGGWGGGEGERGIVVSCFVVM